jgi:CRP/FNR family transcriptional regulator
MTVLCSICPGQDFALCAPAQNQAGMELHSIRGSTRFVKPRQIVRHERQENGELVTLSSGWAFCYRHTCDGRRQILSFLLPGDVVGLTDLYLGHAEPAVQTLTDAKFCVFQLDSVRAFSAGHPLCADRIGRALVQRLGFLERRLISIGKLSASERIAQLILELHTRLRARRLTDSDSMPFPLSQAHIGDALGLTPMHVHRVLKALKDKKLIGLEHRRLEIKDRPGLVSLAKYRNNDLDQLLNITMN